MECLLKRLFAVPGFSPDAAFRSSFLLMYTTDVTAVVQVGAIHLEQIDQVLGFWLRPGPAPAIVGIWGVNQ